MGDELIRKIFINKKNNQASITLPKKLDFLRNKKKPQKIKISIEELFWGGDDKNGSL